jgi:8-oxo-dGTP pyrophosphatase MutT (NUDIX family)
MDTDPLPPKTLNELIPVGVFIGTSLILRQGKRFLYGLRPVKHTPSGPVLELTGIGGKLEPEDDTFSAGVLREVQEEIDCPVRLMACPTTLVVHGPQQVVRVPIHGNERPAALVFRRHRTPPHQPWHPDNQGEGVLVVFAAELLGRPHPVLELPHLLWLQPEHILATARADVPLGELLADGASLVSGPQPAPSLNLPVRLTDSQEALALALGEDTLAFYRSLGC